ncbi:MAG: redoxin domain-containing protein [Deltaproteobacteria bacterium]|nr:redoxin domain-containing protein [Deltaproteobacteria bacterium]
MKRWILFFVIVVPILALLAFGLTRDARELPSTMTGKKAPDFSLKTLEGKEISLKSFEGHPVVLNFWATWCGPCLMEHKIFNEGRKIYEKEGVVFLGVVYQDKKESVQRFLKEYGEPFTVLTDKESKTAIDYGVGGVPETFFIDSHGTIYDKFSGIMTADYLERKIGQGLHE